MSYNRTRKLASVEERVEVDPGWKVIVHNDNHHTYPYVIKVFMTILHISGNDAFELAKLIDSEGSTVVAGPMSNQEALNIAHKISSFGPDPDSMKPEINVGLKTSVEKY